MLHVMNKWILLGKITKGQNVSLKKNDKQVVKLQLSQRHDLLVSYGFIHMKPMNLFKVGYYIRIILIPYEIPIPYH